jgi:tRNA pseudouridine13 synthase
MDVEQLPRAGPVPDVRGRYRSAAEDFVVDEELGFAPSGDGEHLYLRIEKRGENTRWVAAQLARCYGVAPVDVGYAGQKDRHAVTRQWFSVRVPRRDAAGEPVLNGANVTVLAHEWHHRKLRPGDHAANRFMVRLDGLDGDVTALVERLVLLGRAGQWTVPNYFGPQRFGHGGGNTARARAWLVERGRPPRGRDDRALLLSTARAMLFNHVLAARVRDGSWQTPVDGDALAGELPTGPLWGRGRTPVTGRAAALEVVALADHVAWLDPLEHCGLSQDRRPLALTVAEFEVERTDGAVALRFVLPAGGFATSVLRELGRFDDGQVRHG